MEVVLMHWRACAAALALFAASCVVSYGQQARQIVQQAVKTELAADDADHTHWMYFDVDKKPNHSVQQWVAETGKGNLKRLLEENGRELSENEQRARIDRFVHDPAAQMKQRKDGQHDDRQARQMLSMLPQAFLWSKTSAQNGTTVLHFAPNPHFHAHSDQERVYAAMEGEMKVNDQQHRIVSLSGHLTHSVKFGGGLLGNLHAGGSFDVERRQIAKGEWQIVETHVHIAGRMLLFKKIGDQEDDQESKFKELPAGLSLDQAEKMLFQQGRDGN